MTSTLCVINFHGIGTPHDSVHAREVPYWVSADRFRRILDQLKAHRARGQRVKITFDDGNRSDLEIAIPELRARGMTGHFFVLTGRCDDPRYLSAAEIHDIAKSDMIVGLHGQDHVDWRRIDQAALDAETIGARDMLATITGTHIHTVGIPFGGYNRRVMNQLKRAGYHEIYTSDGGHTSERLRLRHRTSVRAEMPEAFIDAVLGGRESLVCQFKRGLKTMLKEYVI
jgi:peptidoglycan/xylan/chitin deacetylase (PgdA/CDA1 family)